MAALHIEVRDLESVAHAQGGFTDAQWNRFCELEHQSDEPFLERARRHVLELNFICNSITGTHNEGAD